MTTLLLAASAVALVDLLIWLLIFVIVVGIVFWILSLLPLPEPWKAIATAIVALILLLVMLKQIGFL